MAFKTNVFLRRAEREDLDTVVEWMEDPDFLHFLYGDPTRSPKQIREQIVSMLGRSVSHTMPGGFYMIIDSKESGPIGLVALQNVSWRNRSCSIDLYIGNKGIRASIAAAISVYRVFEYCFDELNLHRVGAFIYSFNPASWRLMERSGATRELMLRDHVARDGKLYDMYGYGLLRPEWEKLRESMAGQFENVSLKAMMAEQFAEGVNADAEEAG